MGAQICGFKCFLALRLGTAILLWPLWHFLGSRLPGAGPSGPRVSTPPSGWMPLAADWAPSKVSWEQSPAQLCLRPPRGPARGRMLGCGQGRGGAVQRGDQVGRTGHQEPTYASIDQKSLPEKLPVTGWASSGGPSLFSSCSGSPQTPGVPGQFRSQYVPQTSGKVNGSISPQFSEEHLELRVLSKGHWHGGFLPGVVWGRGGAGWGEETSQSVTQWP